MKLRILLATLLFTSTPALADDFVYLKCDALTSLVTKQISTNQVEDKQMEEQRFVKVDVANSRLKFNTGGWENVTLANGVASFKTNDVEGGLTIAGELMLEYSPPGRISIQVQGTPMDDFFQAMSVKGTCQSSDESSFVKAVGQ